ncbi:MAG: DUF924 family protein [Pseudomonadota bacterium]
MINPHQMIEYWYSEKMRKHWFSSTPELDNDIRTRYESLWERAASGVDLSWLILPDYGDITPLYRD